MIALASAFICCKDVTVTAKIDKEPSSMDKEVVESIEKTDKRTNHQASNIQRLKEAFENKNEGLFLEQFPSDHEQFMKYFGWNYKTDQPNELYEESYAYIDYFFNLLSQEKYRKFESKLVGIAKNGSWQEDAINFFQDAALAYIKNRERYGLIEDLTFDEAKSVLFFLFDGPHPKLDTEFASHLSPSKKAILEELFETGFYDYNENPDPIVPDPAGLNAVDDGKSIHYEISDFEGADHFFIRNIDINNDGVLDKIVSVDPYQGDALYLFIKKENEYQFALKTTNFSEDGGNQIVDVVAEEGGFVVKTAFLDGGLIESNYYIFFQNKVWVLTHTIYRTQSSNQEDAVIYLCNVVQELDLEDVDFFEKLKGMPDETQRELLCTKEKRN